MRPMPNGVSFGQRQPSPAFTIWFQPIVNVARGEEIFAHEALLRGPVGEGPASVLNQVPKGKIPEFDAACRKVAVQLAYTLGIPARLHLNIAPGAICDKRFGLDETVRVAQAMGFPEERLVFEIVENEQFSNISEARDYLAICRNLNILIALDDLGAGYNGLNALIELQPEIVKLDMELIRGIDMDMKRRIVVDSVATACRNLGILLIAEGVETREEAVTLRALGITHMQGFLFSRPSPMGSNTVFRYPSHQSGRLLERL